MRRKLLEIFPDALIDQVVSFESLDNNEIRWPSEVIETVIGWMEKKDVAILGRRVFLEDTGEHFLAGLEWKVERNGQDWNEFVQKSAEMSLAFIKKKSIE